jgi:isochorismate synthase
MTIPRVRASRLGPAFDLLAAADAPDGFVFERSTVGVAGAGGGTVTAPDLAMLGPIVVERLRSMAGEPSAVAVGAIPFEDEPISLHIPSRVVRRTPEKETSLIEILEGGDVATFVPEPPRSSGIPHEAFTDLQLTLTPGPDAYAGAVRTATQRIQSGELRKVVLARQIRVEAGRVLDPQLLAARLRAVDPDAYTFVAPTPRGVMVGASPELLVSKHGAEIRSNPLAGSAPRSGDPDEDLANAAALSDSGKNREEHAIVVDAVAETLRPFCEELAWDPEPVLLPTANVWHLSTRFRGVLREAATDVLQLVAALHPTPAVCGSPRVVALAAIHALEPFERGAYAGPVGWIDAEGDGEWAIALRCAELRGDGATLFAGAGIVADSDPEAELDETERKFRAFLDSLRWG